MLGVYWGLDFADRDDYTDAKEKAILNLAQLKENILVSDTEHASGTAQLISTVGTAYYYSS